MQETEDIVEIGGLFDNEPEEFRPRSPIPTKTSYVRNPDFVQYGPHDFIVHLPGKHSLWAHECWNAGKSLANYLDKHKELYIGKKVLELGAAASLPSLICAVNGARKVISTDYPEKPLLDNIMKNAMANIPEKVADGTFNVQGYLWGTRNIDLDEPMLSDGKFDVILMADLVFNHSQHTNLLKTCVEMLANDGIILKTYTHHVAKWAYRDMEFFNIAKNFGFQAEKIYEEKWQPMFPDDVGDVEVRSTVHGWILKR
jgi:nicotinamide N-methyltransferase